MTQNPTQSTPNTAESPIVILVMGRPGRGKTSFIQQAIGSDDPKVAQNINHKLAGTKTIRIDSFPAEVNGRQYLFLDTTGTGKVEASDTKEIESLCQQLCDKPDIHGIIYIHRMLDDRVDRYGLHYIELLETIFGRPSLKNLMILTNHWDEVTPEVGRRREKELRGDFWRGMIDGGATVKKLDGTMPDSMDSILEWFSSCAPTVLAIKDEMMHQGKPFKETSVRLLIDQRVQMVKDKLFPGMDAINRELDAKSAEELRCEVLELRIKCLSLEDKVAQLEGQLEFYKLLEDPKKRSKS